MLNNTSGFSFSSYPSHPTDLCHSDHHSDIEDKHKYTPEVQSDLIYAKVSTLRLYIFKRILKKLEKIQGGTIR